MAKRPKRKTTASSTARATSAANESFPAAFAGKVALIIFAGVAIFWPALNGGWIGDDGLYVLNNKLLNEPDRVWKAWFQIGSFVDYYPIQETVQWAQWKLWHEDTFGYHLTNVLLHITSALLVWRLLAKLGLSLAWLGGLLFVVHPMMVDSVALINELKASLSLPPFLLALCYWIDYEETGATRAYLRALLLFIVAMLCKITMATFPLVILLYAWWKRGRIGWKDLGGTIPFFVVSLVLGLLTIRAGEIFAGPAELGVVAPNLPFLSRFVLTGETSLFYFSRCFLPIDPTPLYHRWKVDPNSPVQYLPWIGMTAIFIWLWFRRKTWGRHALLGLGYFLIMLTPFLGFHWISYMADTWILEHLLYIPILGLIGLLIAALEDFNRHLSLPGQKITIGAILLVAGIFAWISHGYASQFSSEAQICKYVIRVNHNSPAAHYNLGVTELQTGRFDDAREQFNVALELIPPDEVEWSKPKIGLAHNNLAVALANDGRFTEALREFEVARQLDPDEKSLCENIGNTYLQMGQTARAVEQYRIAALAKPDSAHLRLVYGGCLAQDGQFPAAVVELKEAARLDPNSMLAHFSLGLALRQLGQFPEAIAEYRKALALDPQNAQIQSGLTELLNANPSPDNPKVARAGDAAKVAPSK